MKIYKLTEAGIPEWLKIRFDLPATGPEGREEDWAAYACRVMAEQLPLEEVYYCRTGMLVGDLLDDDTSVPVVICTTGHGDYFLVYSSWRKNILRPARAMAVS